MKCCVGGHESVHISVIARVRNNGSTFQSFLHALRGGGLVLGVSVMVRCPYNGVDCPLRNVTFTYSFNYYDHRLMLICIVASFV